MAGIRLRLRVKANIVMFGVKTESVVCEHEGHHFVNPEHLRDLAKRASARFDEYLEVEKGSMLTKPRWLLHVEGASIFVLAIYFYY